MNNLKSFSKKYHYIIGISLILLIPVCFFISLSGNTWINEYGAWCETLSNLYWSTARVPFVIFLSTISIFFSIYEGYSYEEKKVSKMTAILVMLIIIFPTYNKGLLAQNFSDSFNIFPKMNYMISHKIHSFSTMLLFLVQEYNLVFVFSKQLGEKEENKDKRKKIYKFLSLVGVIIIFVTEGLEHSVIYLGRNKLFPFEILVVQFISLVDIGCAWLVRGTSLSCFEDIEK